jgi:hypothetical protein
MRPGKRRVPERSTPMGEIMDKLAQAKVHIRAKVEQMREKVSASGQKAATQGEIRLELGLVGRKSPSSEIACIYSRRSGHCADRL